MYHHKAESKTKYHWKLDMQPIDDKSVIGLVKKWCYAKSGMTFEVSTEWVS